VEGCTGGLKKEEKKMEFRKEGGDGGKNRGPRTQTDPNTRCMTSIGMEKINVGYGVKKRDPARFALRKPSQNWNRAGGVYSSQKERPRKRGTLGGSNWARKGRF